MCLQQLSTFGLGHRISWGSSCSFSKTYLENIQEKDKTSHHSLLPNEWFHYNNMVQTQAANLQGWKASRPSLPVVTLKLLLRDRQNDHGLYHQFICPTGRAMSLSLSPPTKWRGLSCAQILRLSKHTTNTTTKPLYPHFRLVLCFQFICMPQVSPSQTCGSLCKACTVLSKHGLWVPLQYYHLDTFQIRDYQGNPNSMRWGLKSYPLAGNTLQPCR